MAKRRSKLKEKKKFKKGVSRNHSGSQPGTAAAVIAQQKTETKTDMAEGRQGVPAKKETEMAEVQATEKTVTEDVTTDQTTAQPVVKDFVAEEVEHKPPLLSRQIGGQKMHIVRVYRSNVEPENRDLPITLCVNDSAKRIHFWPGQLVSLSEAEINVLRDSVELVEIVIPAESGIYQSPNPEETAKRYYPNMILSRDSLSGLIKMIKRSPNYIIEFVEKGY